MENEKYIIPNLKKACLILNFLADEEDGKSAGEISKALEIPRTTVIRILSTLTSENFTRKEGKKYLGGYQLIQLGGKLLNKINLRKIANSVLHQLSNETRETSHLATPAHYKSLLVEVVDSPEPVRAASKAGTLVDLYCSSTGKCFLAWKYADEIETLLSQTVPQKRTPNTQTTLQEILAGIEETKSKGYAMDDEEYNRGIRCLAAPVFGATGEIIAAIGITAGTSTFQTSMEEEIAQKVISSAKKLTQLVGGFSPIS